jgi:hypothetical protein
MGVRVPDGNTDAELVRRLSEDPASFDYGHELGQCHVDRHPGVHHIEQRLRPALGHLTLCHIDRSPSYGDLP